MNMGETLTERLTKTPEGMRLYQQERAIQELTDLVCELMEEQDLSRSELAQRLGKTKGYITQLLDGRTNMTVRTISDLFAALNRTVHFQEGPVSATVSPSPTITLFEDADWGQPGAEWPEIEGHNAPTAVRSKLAS
jgi:transcriptional regulator with XRE-family HTH domain